SAFAKLNAEETARGRELCARLGRAVRLEVELDGLNAFVSEQQRVLDHRGHALHEQQTAIEELRGHLDRTAAHSAQLTKDLEKLGQLELELDVLRAAI